MILFVLLAPYTVEAGRMDIINGEIKEFSEGVKVKAGDFVLYGDKGKIHGDSAWIMGHLKILDKDRIITGKRGYYNKQDKIGYISLNVEMNYKSERLRCDSLIYNKKMNSVELIKNVKLAEDKSLISCETGIYNFQEKKMKFSGKPVFLNQTKDTLRVVADTILYSTQDSVFIFLWNVHIKSGKTSGNADKLKFYQKKNIAMLKGNPIIFTSTDTLGGDSIYLYSSDTGIDSVLSIGSKTFSKGKDGLNRLESDIGKVVFAKDKPQDFYFEGNVKGIFVKNETDSTKSK